MRYIYFVLTLLFVAGCQESPEEPVTVPQPQSRKITLSENALLRATADSIICSIEQSDTDMLRQFAGSEIVISPYVFVDPEVHVELSLDSLFSDKNNRLWAYEDGSGREIRLTAKSYLEKYVLEDRFSNAPQVSVNVPIGIGNSEDNTQAFLKNDPYVEYYYPGFDEKFGGLDWVSLRVYLHKTGSGYKLSGLIGNCWTI